MQNEIKDLVFASDGNKVMTTSLKVAEVFEKEHSNVVLAIDKLVEKLQEADNQCDLILKGHMFEAYYDDIPQPNGGTKPAKRYVMNRDGFTLLAMGFNGKKALEFKIAYIDAFNAMEEELKNRMPALPDFTNPAAAARAWAAEYEEKCALQLVNKQQASELMVARPKAEYFDGLVDRNLLTGVRETAKELHVKQNDFIGWLMANNYLYRDKRNKLQPYAEYNNDLFELKDKKNEQTGWTGTQLFVTVKG